MVLTAPGGNEPSKSQLDTAKATERRLKMTGPPPNHDLRDIEEEEVGRM